MAGEVVLSAKKRDEILKALTAVEHQLRRVVSKSDWQTLYVIETNLTLIRASVINMPPTNQN
jgi:hypothetical protein